MTDSLKFSVRRYEPVLVAPAEPTPHEFKSLSDIDDQHGLRFQIPVIHFYPSNPSMEGQDPVRVIREALAKALIFYYPFAGRIRDGSCGKLVVECTGEGVLFVEADADVRLEQFGNPPQPPFPCMEELLHNVEGSDDVLHSPLLLIQVTRLMCGGFILALRVNHTMCDAVGLAQFMSAIGEMARGAIAPNVPPVWARELLTARAPPRVTHEHLEFNKVLYVKGTLMPLGNMVRRSFFLGPSEMLALRNRLPPHLRTCSTFEIVTACIWRCRGIALGLHPEQEVRTVFVVSSRSMLSPPLPKGYYGNVFATPAAVSTAGRMCSSPLGYALELVKKAKAEVTAEYMQSVADLMVLRGRPHYSVAHAYLVSDVTESGFDAVDFGWGKPVYGGPATGAVGVTPGEASFYTSSRNCNGEDGVLVPVSLPALAMEKFIVEMECITKEPSARVASCY